MPYMVYEQVTGEPLVVTMGGTTALTTERWRLSCYGSTYSQAKKFAKYVRWLLINVVPNTPLVGNIIMSGAYVVLEADEAEPLGRGTLFSTHLDFEFVYSDGDTKNFP